MYNNQKLTIMFFQTIHQMLSQGTNLSINIRRVNNNLTVAVMPKRTGLKEEAGQLIVLLVLSGTPVDLDAEFLQQITFPLQKVQGILTNIETFEKQAEAAAAQSKAAKSANDKETKEAREKREKMEKLIKRGEEAFAAGRYSEATTVFRQAKVLADATKQKEIEAKMQEVQKKASEGSLFGEADPQSQPVQQQPTAHQQPSVPKQPVETFCFDKDDESDRELLREDLCAEYPDFPKEYRMKNAAQMELVCC